MSQKEPTWLDGILGSQLRDTQGEMLSIEGADISELESGRGRWNDNHGKGYFNSLGRITYAKKIFKAEDCEDDRQRYYWDKIKAPFIYGKGYLFDDEDHPNAKAAAAILRNIHKTDSPLKLKLSVEGGVVARGVKDPSILARTKIHSCAITFTPANQNTLCEPLNISKTSSTTWEQDKILIKSVLHLAKSDVPSFRHITRRASAEKIVENMSKVRELVKTTGLNCDIPDYNVDELVVQGIEHKLQQNIKKINQLIKAMASDIDPIMPKPSAGGQEVQYSKLHKNLTKINEFIKALTAGYGGGEPTSATGGKVLQTESLDLGRGFKYITCPECGHEQIYMKHQVKCRECNKNLPLAKLYGVMVQGG